MDQKKVSIMVLLDCSAAFNSVDFEILLAQCKYIYNFSDSTIDFLKSYLYERKQRVIGSQVNISDWTELKRSVPAGAVFGPMLFALYFGQFSKILSPGLNYHFFADDIQLYTHCSVEPLPTALANLNEDLDRISTWARNRGVLLNPLKTQLIVVGTSNKLSKIPWDLLPQVTINGTVIERSKVVKDLGVSVDENLNWQKQVQETCKKVYGSLHSLNRMRNLLSVQAKRQLVQTFIFPIFDYCQVCLTDIRVEQLNKLNRALNSCVRFIFNLKKRDHISRFYKELKWLKIENRRKLQLAVQTFKIVNNLSPEYLKNEFVLLSVHNSRESRSGNTLKIPAHKTDAFARSFAVSAARLWNSIPSGIRELRTVRAFREAYKELLFNNQ